MTIQTMSKSGNASVKVFYRIFSVNEKCWEDVKVKDKHIVLLRNIHAMSKVGLEKKIPTFYEFITDGVFFNTSQEEIYETIMKDVLARVMDGSNAIVAAFGQTGTGKSVTLYGLQMTVEHLGIAPRIISDLFDTRNQLPNNIKICIQMSYIEFSRTTVNDLLARNNRSLEIWHVKKDITKVKVKTLIEAMKVLFIAEGRKSFASNGQYDSHLLTSVLTFYVTTKNAAFSEPYKICSKLHIIDMAGFDTVGKASCDFKKAHDIGMANIMKNDIIQFFLCILEKHPEQTKQKERQNPLIYFLREDLINDSSLRFIGHIKIHREELPITISALRFGQILKGMKPLKKDKEFEENEESKIVFLENQIEKLQKEKLQNSVLMNQDLSRNLNQARIDHLNRTLQCYLKDQISEISVMNVAEVSTIFKMLKELCNQAEAERAKILLDRQSSSSDTGTKPRRPTKSLSKVSADFKALRKYSRRKSKELPSLPVIDDRVTQVEKGTSAHSMASKEHTLSKTSYVINKSATSINTSVGPGHRKKSRASSGKITPTKKSSGSVVGIRRESLNLPLLPEKLPDQQEAWAMYSEQISYKTLQEDYTANEEKIKEVHASYLEEVRKLHDLREVIDAKNNELVEINMLQNLNSSKIAEGETNYFVESDISCRDILQQAEADLLTQEETVLRAQSELKIHLNNRKELKDQLNEDFENFCKNNFNVPMPIIRRNSGQRSEHRLRRSVSRSKTKITTRQSELSLKLDDLRKAMKKEQIKTLKEREKQALAWKR